MRKTKNSNWVIVIAFSLLALFFLANDVLFQNLLSEQSSLVKISQVKKNHK